MPVPLACAYYLVIDGYKVTVFEKEKSLGGMLTLGIPSYRLEKDVVNAEIDILREMGVAFNTGVEFIKCVSVFDENGRFCPAYDENETKVVEADHVLISVGQAMDWGNLIAGSRIELNPNQTIKADELTFQTGEPDVFAGGDALIGPSFAINAIAMGKEGAISIHRYVHPGQSLVLGRIKREYVSFDKKSLNLSGYDRVPREKTEHVDGKKSKKTFKDYGGGHRFGC